MAKILAARVLTTLEFFAQQRQKTLLHLPWRQLGDSTTRDARDADEKKARREAGCKVQGKLENLVWINGDKPFRRVS
jgi:hypothetical protein